MSKRNFEMRKCDQRQVQTIFANSQKCEQNAQQSNVLKTTI